MDPSKETQNKLAEELRRAREGARLTQEQLAELAEISVGPIYLFESGKTSIRLETYLRLLEALGLEMNVVPRKPRHDGV